MVLSTQETASDEQQGVAVPCPISFVEVVGLDEPEGRVVADVVQAVAVLLTLEHPFIDLQHVARFVVGFDYARAIERWRPSAEAFAPNFSQVAVTSLGVCFLTDEGVVVLVHGDLLSSVLGSPATLTADGARIVVHELCHGHDLGRRQAWLRRSAPSTDQREEQIWSLCNALWSEYFANRYSYFCSPSLDCDWTRLEVLLDALPSLTAGQAAQSAAAVFGYVLGSLSASGAELESLRPDLVGRLSEARLGSAWDVARRETGLLAQTGEAWQSADGLSRLRGAAKQIAHAFEVGECSACADGS